MRPSTSQRSSRLRRAMSAIVRPSSGALGRPTSSAKRQRPYSAYTRKGSEEEGPKYEAPETGREWWRFYLKVCCFQVKLKTIYLHARPYFCRKLLFQAVTATRDLWMTFKASLALTALGTAPESSPLATSASSERASSCYLEHMKSLALCTLSQGRRSHMASWLLKEMRDQRLVTAMGIRWDAY